MTIKELEELIKATPNKDLPIHYLGESGELKFEVKEARLEDKALLLIEGDELSIEDEDEDEEEVEDE